MNNREAIKKWFDEQSDETINAMYRQICESNKTPTIELEVEHYYEFTGTWSWGVWATSKEEAERYFKSAYTDDFEILTDEYKVEQYE